MNARLRKDLKSFIDTYYKFELLNTKIQNIVILKGVIDIVDENDGHWESYKIKIVFNENEYPNVIPSVIELSNKINRNWDFHISKKGECCLDIPHTLLRYKRRGIELTNFYKDVIYPFFANHQYLLKEGNYANGEYLHEDKGVVQFYKEEFGLSEPNKIIQILKLALGLTKAEANKECPICGKPKYKKCCRPIVNQLLIYGNERLRKDFDVFQNILNIN